MVQTLDNLIVGVTAEILGDPQHPVWGAQPLDSAGENDMAFVAGKENIASAAKSAAGILFVEPHVQQLLSSQAPARTYVVSDDPKGLFFTALARLKPIRERDKLGISPAAYIHQTAKIGPGTNVYPGATISAGVTIGEHCDIGPGSYIGPGTTLGNNVSLHPNVVLYHDLTIGNDVTIQAGSIVGADGFGYRTINGIHERLHHFGTVRIEDHVDVGACTTIDRAVIGETVIGQGTKIDNNVVIAHNCRLGQHNLLVSQVGFAGSVTTGDYVVCAGQVGIADHVHIGTGAMLGAKAGVHKNLDGGQSYLGAPATPVAEATRAVMAMQKLPQLRKTVRELERQVANLQSQLNPEATQKPVG